MKPLILALLAASAVSLPAAAQTMESAERDIAQCLVDNDSSRVASLLRTLPGSAAERRVSKPLIQLYGACYDNVPAQGAFAWRDRAQLAAAAVAGGAGKRGLDLASAARQPGWMLEPAAGQVAGTDYDASSVSLLGFGACIVKLAPEASLALVRAEAMTAAEAAAVTALKPAVADCIQPGQKLRLTRENLRLIVSEPLYHLLAR